MAVVEQSVVRSLPNNHPNIVKFHDAGISKADNEIRYFILSEYCPGNVLKKMSGAAVSVCVCVCVLVAPHTQRGRALVFCLWRRLFCPVPFASFLLVSANGCYYSR